MTRKRRRSPDAPKRLAALRRRASAIRWVEQISAVTSLLVFVGTIVKVGFSASVWSAIAVTWVCAIASIAIYLLIVQEQRFRRQARYALTLDLIQSIFRSISDLQVDITDSKISHEVAVDRLRTVLSTTVNVFQVVAGAACRSCIKLVTYPASNAAGEGFGSADSLRPLQVQTLARDEVTGPQRSDDQVDYVDRNSDFEEIFLSEDTTRSWFVSNDLDNHEGYTNSHSDYSYRSTCVWPIQRREGTATDPRDAILGFLCVDSTSRYVFDETFDYHLGAAIASALYSVLKMLRAIEHNAVLPPTPSQPSEQLTGSTGAKHG